MIIKYVLTKSESSKFNCKLNDQHLRQNLGQLE